MTPFLVYTHMLQIHWQLNHQQEQGSSISLTNIYKYADSWQTNSNIQLYISYSVSLKKTVWHVPGTLWRPGKCRFVNCQQCQLSTMLWHTSYWRFLMYLHGYMVTSPSLVKSGFINQKSWKKPKSYNLSNPFPSENGF